MCLSACAPFNDIDALTNHTLILGTMIIITMNMNPPIMVGLWHFLPIVWDFEMSLFSKKVNFKEQHIMKQSLVEIYFQSSGPFY